MAKRRSKKTAGTVLAAPPRDGAGQADGAGMEQAHRTTGAASSYRAAPAPPTRDDSDPALTRLQALARRAGLAIAAAALAVFALGAVFAARTNTPTPDEFVYVPAGLYHLQTGDLSFDPTNPPLLKMLMALPLTGMDVKLDLDPKARDNSTGWGPWVFGTSFMNLNRERYLDAFFAARLVVVAFGVALGALVFARAREILSPAAAVACVLLFATLPPVIAHSAVATLDIGVTVFMFAGLLAASRFGATKEWGWAVLTGAMFGLGLAVKGTAALYAPLVPVLVALEWKDWKPAGLRWFVAGGAIIAASTWAAIEVAYGFSGFPLPAPFVEGIRFQMNASSAGEFPAFLFGNWSPKGWWYYYVVALGLKAPLPFLVLVIAGVAAAAQGALRSRGARGRRPAGESEAMATDLAMLLPPLLLLYVLSFHYAKDYGVRYLLPAFPFLVLLAGRGADLLLKSGPRARIALGVLLVWQAASAAWSAPQQLAYFNELAGGTDRARHLLLDSNLDWGQDLGRAAAWFREHGVDKPCLGYFGHVDPRVYGLETTFPPVAPKAGLCAVSANFLGGYPYAITYAGPRILGVKAGAWSWFDRLQPVARIGSSIYVFDVSADDAARLGGGAGSR